MDANYICPMMSYMNQDSELDTYAQVAVMDWILDAGIDGMLISGSSSEFAYMTEAQRAELLRFCITYLKGKTRVIAVTASNSAAQTISLSNFCLGLGAESVMVLPPYYFRLSQEQLFAYYDTILPQIKGKVFFYNYPDATGHALETDTISRLVLAHSNLCGLKDTIPGMSHTREVISWIKESGIEFEVYSGFDGNFSHNILSGGSGCMGGLSNVFPKFCTAWRDAFREENLEKIAEMQRVCNRLMQLYAVGKSFPATFKELVKMQGFPVKNNCSLPLGGTTEAEKTQIHEIVRASGVLQWNS